MIALLDYGSGNLRSVEKALRKVGADVQIGQDASVLKHARGAVLPGVGAFDDCISAMRKQELFEGAQRFIQSGRRFWGFAWDIKRSSRAVRNSTVAPLVWACSKAKWCGLRSSPA